MASKSEQKLTALTWKKLGFLEIHPSFYTSRIVQTRSSVAQFGETSKETRFPALEDPCAYTYRTPSSHDRSNRSCLVLLRGRSTAWLLLFNTVHLYKRVDLRDSIMRMRTRPLDRYVRVHVYQPKSYKRSSQSSSTKQPIWCAAPTGPTGKMPLRGTIGHPPVSLHLSFRRGGGEEPIRERGKTTGNKRARTTPEPITIISVDSARIESGRPPIGL